MSKINAKNFVIAIETSGRKGSVALAKGTFLLEQYDFPGQMEHAANILPAIEHLLKNHNFGCTDITHICLSIGPGSFTGLRIAATLAKTLVLAQPSVKIITVDTLDLIAQNFTNYPEPQNASIASVLDAKRGQFYIATFKYRRELPTDSDTMAEENHHIYRTSENLLLRPENFIENYTSDLKPIFLLGEGLLYYKDRFAHPNTVICPETLWYPSAANVHRLAYPKVIAGQFEPPQTLRPQYLRDPDAKPKRI